MISAHAKGCVRVVAVWDRLHVGLTEKCAYKVQLKAANQVTKDLNAAKSLLEEW